MRTYRPCVDCFPAGPAGPCWALVLPRADVDLFLSLAPLPLPKGDRGVLWFCKSLLLLFAALYCFCRLVAFPCLQGVWQEIAGRYHVTCPMYIAAVPVGLS
eukprot:RCo042776